MLNPATVERIRTIFLHHESRVTIDVAADMLGWSRAEMKAAIRNGDIELIGTCSGKMIELRELFIKIAANGAVTWDAARITATRCPRAERATWR